MEFRSGARAIQGGRTGEDDRIVREGRRDSLTGERTEVRPPVGVDSFERRSKE
ncbi:MAG: hypothetical protein WD066_16630 [Planctomycetaceae bacterium]